ncbi:putative snare protein [Botrytis fragariae]|uniref:Putative snare protein n=1 Tax=Botrytis fragariae TaxID=1964551 RepID=A0A8H6ENR9_9HELO|nr:putative snare protein [Botrytis fragariae]KAF5878987.1 putative snare protein [Botrytis fragariae]
MAQYGNNYGGGQNPYAQQNSPGYPQSPQYDNGAAMGRDSYGGEHVRTHNKYHLINIAAGQNVEMASLAQNGSQPGQQMNPNYILNACRDIDNEINAAAQYAAELDDLGYRVQTELDQASIARKLDLIAEKSSTQFKAIIEEISKLKRMPESGSPMNQSQIGRVQRKLKQTMEAYKAKEMDFEHKIRDQMRREYRIVNPEATESEVNAAVPNAEPQQMFQQALMTSNRQGQANTTLNAVRQRNEAIKKIEQDIIQIAELFSEMENLVVQQEAAVVNIEMKGEEVVENMDKGVQQMDTAIVSARSRNRKKWYCLGLVVIIVAIIAIVLAVHFTSNKSDNSTKATTKRAVVPGTDFTTSDRFVVPGASFVESRMVVAGKDWSEEKAVVPGADFTPVVRKWKKFIA